MTLTARKLLLLLRTTALAGGILFASALEAQTPSYFPLEVGNTWLYRAFSINPSFPNLQVNYSSVTVRSSEKIGGKEYFNVSYFGRDVTLRVEPTSGDVLSYNRASGAESPWVSLSLPVGGSFPTSINPCPTQGTITSHNSQVFTDVGDFENQFEVTYKGSCADTGVILQYYAPGVGLARDEEATIGGKIVYTLMYYRVGPIVGTPPEVSFTTAVQAQHYYPISTIQARLTLRNSGTDPVNLHYPSSQNFDFQILNEKGDIVFTWSSDKSFLAAVRDESLGTGELNYGVTVSLLNLSLPLGRYIARGFLTTDPIVYQGQVAFEIVPFPKF